MDRYMDDEAFKALVQSTTFASSGLLNPEQADAFIDTVVKQQRILDECRIERMVNNSMDLDLLDMAARQLRKHAAGVEGTSATISSSKRTLTLAETKIWFDMDIRTLRRLTIEADGKDVDGKLMRHVMNMAAVRMGNDFQDLGLNGDATLDTGAYPFQSICNGWVKLAIAAANTYDYGTEVNYMEVIFDGMLAELDEQWKADPKALRFYTTTTIRDAYIKQIGGTGTAGSLQYITGQVNPTFRGIEIVGVPRMPTGNIMLTNPRNLAFGIDKNNIERDFDKNAIARTIRPILVAPIGYQIVVPSAMVIGYPSS